MLLPLSHRPDREDETYDLVEINKYCLVTSHPGATLLIPNFKRQNWIWTMT